MAQYMFDPRTPSLRLADKIEEGCVIGVPRRGAEVMEYRCGDVATELM